MPRRKVREDKKRGINFLDQLAIGLGLVAYTLPFRIIAEGLPVGGGGFATRMREDVHEGFAFEGFVGRRPVRYVFDAVLFEELHGVVTKAAQQILELAVINVIDAELIDRR